MINFEEELKKFHKSPEVEDTESTIFGEKVVDVMDMFLDLANEDGGAYMDMGAPMDMDPNHLNNG
ncbi:MAG: hypothetical protein K6E50_01845 [Lachnospiraceae bacterium]|nr:hypothetical protein [Lachnospiraceae bacterium]